MKKKFILSLILCCFVMSCGKKGDPVYKSSKKTRENIILIIKV